MEFLPTDFETLPCDFCGSEERALRYTKRGFAIVQCEKCGMVYTNPRLKAEKIGELYDADYFQGHGFDTSVNYVREVDEYGEHQKTYTLNDWDADTIAELLGKQVARTPPATRRLLEIGCGTGVFLAKAREHGFYVEGL